MRCINSLLNSLLDINYRYITPMLLSLFLMFMCCTSILVLDDYLYRYLSNWRLLVLLPIIYLFMYLTLRPALFAFKNWIALINDFRGWFRHEK